MSRRRMERTEVKILLQGILSLSCSWMSRKVILLCIKTEGNYLCVLVVWNQNSIPLPRNLFLQMEQICHERTRRICSSVAATQTVKSLSWDQASWDKVCVPLGAWQGLQAAHQMWLICTYTHQEKFRSSLD